MKYLIMKDAAAADTAALITAFDALELTIEGTAHLFRKLMPIFDKISAFAADNLKPVIAVESQFKLQNASAGWTIQTITDEGATGFKSFIATNVAQFTKGSVYLVDQWQAAALQVIPTPMYLQVPINKSEALTLTFASTTVPYFAYENTTPMGLNTVQCIQCDIVPANIQQNSQRKLQGRMYKFGSTLAVTQSK